MKEIKGTARVLGLIGDPVEHTLSPFLHNRFAEDTGISAVYVPFPVASGGLRDAVRGAFALGILGLNVTVPHKQAVMPYLTEIDPAAAAVGAVNTLVRTEEGFKGYNTDVSGFSRELEVCGIEAAGKSAVILGAGGAAVAVLHVLLSLGASHVWILNRSAAKAEAKFGGLDRVTVLSPDRFREIREESFLCVQCTSVGLWPNREEAPILDPDFYRRVEKAVDLIYRPSETRFMRLVREAGGQAWNGLSMLIFQAAEAFRLFTGSSVPAETLEAVKREVMEQGE